MNKVRLIALAAVLPLVTSASGCATANMTPLQRNIAQCSGAIAVGTLLGAAIGNNTGSGDAQQGAAYGAGAGVGVCGILLLVNSAQDRQRIQNAERRAIYSGRQEIDQFPTSGGQMAQVIVSPRPAPVSPPNFAPKDAPDGTKFTPTCRRVDSRIMVEGQAGAADVPTIYCLTEGKNFLPYPVDASRTA